MLEDKQQLNKNGVGLGLNIAKTICHVFDGDITIDSKVGKGSNFKFTFDITPVAQVGNNNQEDTSEYKANISDFYYEWKPKSTKIGKCMIKYEFEEDREEIKEEIKEEIIQAYADTEVLNETE